MADAPESPRPHGLTERALELVTTTTTWKRTAILLVMGFSALVAWSIIVHPEWVVTLLERQAVPTYALVPAEQITTELPVFRRAARAEIAAVFGTSLERNTQWLVASDADPAVVTRDALDRLATDYWSTLTPIFGRTENWNSVVANILDGEIGCTVIDPTQPEHPVFHALHLIEVCAVGIPPGPEALVGYVILGFAAFRDRPDHVRVRTLLRHQADAWVVEE